MKRYYFACVYALMCLYFTALCFGGEAKNEESSELAYYRAQVISFRQEYSILNKKIEELSQLNAQQQMTKLQLESQIEQLKKENKRLSLASKGRKQTGVSGEDKDKEGLKKQVSLLIQERDDLKKNLAVLESMIESQTANIRIPSSQKTDEKNANKAIHINLGYAYGLKGKYKEAVQEYRNALQYAPLDKDIYFNLGYLLTKQKKYKEAIEAYQQSLKLAPQDREIYYNLSIIYANNLNDPINSQECYKKFKALSIDSGIPP